MDQSAIKRSWLYKPLLIGMFTIGFLVMSLGEGYSKEVLIKRSQYLMGTIVFVTGVATEEKVAKNAVALSR